MYKFREVMVAAVPLLPCVRPLTVLISTAITGQHSQYIFSNSVYLKLYGMA